MVVRMRSTKSHRNNRRSHFAIKAGAVSVCPNCGKSKMPHGMCLSCGMYNGKKIVDMTAKAEKKLRKQQEKQKAQGR